MNFPATNSSDLRGPGCSCSCEVNFLDRNSEILGELRPAGTYFPAKSSLLVRVTGEEGWPKVLRLGLNVPAMNSREFDVDVASFPG